MFKKIAIVADHNGESKKQLVEDILVQQNIEAVYPDYTNSADNDYPDIVQKAYDYYLDGKVDALILLCGTGVGMCIAANKCPGLRCVLAANAAVAAFGRIHEDCNALSVGVGYKDAGNGISVKLSTKQLQDIVKAFISTPFEGGRHLRRVQKIENFSCLWHKRSTKPKNVLGQNIN